MFPDLEEVAFCRFPMSANSISPLVTRANSTGISPMWAAWALLLWWCDCQQSVVVVV